MRTRTFGPAYDAKLDGTRLTSGRERLRLFMLGRNDFLTVEEIKRSLERLFPGCRFPENSLQANLRHLRKAAFGKHDVQRRRRCSAHGPGPVHRSEHRGCACQCARGVWEYRVLPPAVSATEWVSRLRSALQREMFG